MTQQDLRILEGIKNGNDAIWSNFYKDNYAMVKQYILKNSGNKEQVKDTYQEAMMVLYKNIQKDDFILNSKLSTYFFSIAKNLWLKHLRDSKRISAISDKLNELPAILSDEKAIVEKQILLLMDKVATIGEPCSVLLKAFYFLKKSMKEIALEMNYANDKTAKAQKYKCVQRLRNSVDFEQLNTDNHE